MWLSRFGVRALSIPDFDSCGIVDCRTTYGCVRRLSAISKIDLATRTRFWSWFPLTRRSMICLTERHWTRLIQVFHRYRQESATPTQYLHGNADLATEDEFWRIRTDTGELAETERNALR